MDFETIVLKRMELNLQHRFPNVELEAVHDYITESMILKMRNYIAEQELKPLEFETPATWWEHFKETYFPLWLEKWFPVRYAKTVFDASVWYPQVALPQEKHQIVVKRIKPFDGVIV